ncbi:helix-turn-helix domain-containing protein [Ruegeria pomeroyi]|nr:helix-turn-helix domain-containing protein [Ruegeria pomeroyi]
MGAETTLKLVKAETRQTQFDIIVAPGFVLTELAALVDVLRIANRVCPHPPFAYTYRSLRGGLIESSSGAVVATERVPAQPRADYLFVIGNSDPDQPELSLGRVVKDYTFRGAQVFLLAEAASRYINERGTADLATHWENAAFLRERGARFDATFSLATEQGPVVTCAGMGTTPNNFYREMRLAKANSLLLNTAMSVREIGLACGFPNGFSAVYKSFYGVTPFVLRRQKRAAVQR